jgi:methyl coenzyme M reductase subunit C
MDIVTLGMAQAGFLKRIKDPASDVSAALNATFVRFEDEAGNPLPTRSVVIKVSATTGEIIDIVSEA